MAKNTNVTAYVYNKIEAPKLGAPVSGWHQDKSDYYAHIGGFPIGARVKGSSDDGMTSAKFKNKAKHYLEEYVDICCNYGKAINLKRDFNFNNKGQGWQPYNPSPAVKNLEKTSGCSEQGYYRVTRPDSDGVRYIIFVRGYKVTNYRQEAEEILKKNYLFGGEFYIINTGKTQMYYVEMTYQNISLTTTDIKNLLAGIPVPNCIYEVEYYKK